MSYSIDQSIEPIDSAQWARENAERMSEMTYVQKLTEWFNWAKTQGLVDVKFFRGSDPTTTLEQRAKAVFNAVTCDNYEEIQDLDEIDRDSDFNAPTVHQVEEQATLQKLRDKLDSTPVKRAIIGLTAQEWAAHCIAITHNVKKHNSSEKHVWVPIEECVDLENGEYYVKVTNDQQFFIKRHDGKWCMPPWLELGIAAILSPQFGPIPERK